MTEAEAKVTEAKGELDATQNSVEVAKKAKVDADAALEEAKAFVDEKKAAVKAIEAEVSAVEERKAAAKQERENALEAAIKEAEAGILSAIADAKEKAEVEAAAKAEKEVEAKAEESIKSIDDALENTKNEINSRVEAAKAEVAKAEEGVKAAEDNKKRLEADVEARQKDIEAAKAEVQSEHQKSIEAAEEASKAAAGKVVDLEKALEEAKAAVVAAEQRAKDVENMEVDLTQIAPGGRLPLAANYLEKYLGIAGSADEIVETFNDIAANMEETIRSRNIVILGQYGFGSVSVGEDFARSFYDMGICSARAIAKIKAAALNKMSMEKIKPNMEKLAGGCLVIDNAGLLAPEKLVEIVKLSAKDVNDFVVIMTGEIDSISRLFGNSAEVVSEFEYLIDMTKIEKTDMVKVAMGYIKQRAYKADPALENKINDILMGMEQGNLDRMIGAIDEAIAKCDKRDDNKKTIIPADFE